MRGLSLCFDHGLFYGEEKIQAGQSMKYRWIGIAGLIFAAVLGGANTVYAELAAVKITQENSWRLPKAGLDGIGGVGDWFLSNGHLCAVISGREHQTYLSPYGGVLVDLWHCEKANDQWVTFHEQYNMDKQKIPPVETIQPQVSGEHADIIVIARLDGIQSVTRFRMGLANKGVLELQTTLTRYAEGDALQMLGSNVLHPRGAMAPYTLDISGREFSIGFAQPDVDTAKPKEILKAITRADLQVLVGDQRTGTDISYGLQPVSATLMSGGERETLEPYLIASETFTIFGVFTEDYWQFARKPGAYDFIVSKLMDLDQGDTLTIEQRVIVSEVSDVASVTDQLYEGKTLVGQVDSAVAGIDVWDGNGQALTFVRPDESGQFRCRLPKGVKTVDVKVMSPWGQVQKSFNLDSALCQSGQCRLPALTTGEYGELLLPRGKTLSLIFKGLDGKPDPLLLSSLTGLTVGGKPLQTGPANNRVSLAGVASDRDRLILPVGRYRVIATRGMEYELSETEITIKPGEQWLEIEEPQRAFATPDSISADFHVHSGISMDSSLLPRERIIDFVAQGADLLVPTEHNITVDFQPLIDELGLTERLYTLPGVEVTGMLRSEQAPLTIGHSNVFPVEADPKQFLGGTLAFENKRLGQVVDLYKKTFPDSVFQMNHPRLASYDQDLAFFEHLSFGEPMDISKPLDQAPNHTLIEKLPGSDYRDIDFDVMELLSGEALASYQVLKQDWFYLLKHNLYKVATANSDSHFSKQLVAYPRTYLNVPEGQVSAQTVSRALKSGAVMGTTGPILTADLSGVGSGGTLVGREAQLTVMVQAASWVDVSLVRIFINGDLYKELPVSVAKPLSLTIPFQEDSFLVVEAQGDPGELYSIVVPNITPIAFINPIFVDVEGDGYRYNTRH